MYMSELKFSWFKTPVEFSTRVVDDVGDCEIELVLFLYTKQDFPKSWPHFTACPFDVYAYPLFALADGSGFHHGMIIAFGIEFPQMTVVAVFWWSARYRTRTAQMAPRLHGVYSNSRVCDTFWVRCPCNCAHGQF